MWLLSKCYRFEASHRLPSHDGKCSRLHGHSWVVKVTIAGQDLHGDGPAHGMVVDFEVVDKWVRPVVERLDHQHLNDIDGLSPPTSEVLAYWIFIHVERAVGTPAVAARLVSVLVNETCIAAAEYTKGIQ